MASSPNLRESTHSTTVEGAVSSGPPDSIDSGTGTADSNSADERDASSTSNPAGRRATAATVSGTRSNAARLQALKKFGRSQTKVSNDGTLSSGSANGSGSGGAGSPRGSRSGLSKSLSMASFRGSSASLNHDQPPVPRLPAGYASSASSSLSLSSSMDLGKNHMVSSAYDANLVPILPARREDQPSLDSAPPSLYWRRVRMMNTIILRMQHPRSGLERRDRKKMFKVYARTFLGHDLLDWVMEHCDFLSREEGARFCGLLFSEGYIISVDLADRFTADNSMYVFQSPHFWPSPKWQPSDFDYAVYLLKRTSRSADKYVLADWEEDRLRRVQEQLHGQWENVERTAGFHIKHEKSALSKPERRLYHLQEYSFWRTQRAQIPGDREDDARSRRTTTTEDAYIRTMKGQKLLDWLERKCESLNISLTVNRVKVSQASRALISRCEIWRNLDPMLDSTSTAPNPWHSEENSITAAIYAKEGWARMTEPTYAEIKMWTTNFNDLMRDPVGVRQFYEFVQKEFSQENLEFYLKCRALDSVSSRKEYVDRARAIYEEFVKAGAPRELNLPSSDRSAIIAQFDALENASPGQAESLSYYVFADALKHILALMAKDSYVRFCNSDMLADALRRAGSQRDSWDETSRGSGTSSKKLNSTLG